MFLSRISVRRPIAMTAFIIVLVMIGASLYPRLSIDLLPKMEIPTVLVRCEYQGASPSGIETEIIAASVRNPIHVTDCALAGADIATVPYKVIDSMISHPLTTAGIERFLADWSTVVNN